MNGLITGDVLYRKSNALGPFRIPFSKLVAILSKSKYSHASIVLKEDSITYVLEISEDGVTKMPLEKWECLCIGNVYSIYRLKQEIDENLIAKEIKKIFEEKPDYNFTFDDPEKLYCTESVVKIYERAGYPDIFTPKKIGDIVPFWILCIMKPVNWVIKLLTNKGLAFNIPLYFVGNEKQGMMASLKMYKVKDVYISQI